MAEDKGNDDDTGERRWSWDSMSRDSDSDDEEFCDYDDMLYCDICFRAYEGWCPKHGPNRTIKDIRVPKNVEDKLRAKKTAPSVVIVEDVMDPYSGGGVRTREAIAARTAFGPYQGQIILTDDHNKEFSWTVFRNGERRHVVDASEPGVSNWMRYVKRAARDGDQNLNAFQHFAKMYYRTIRDVAADEELVVWYSDQVGSQLGKCPDGVDSGAPPPGLFRRMGHERKIEEMANEVTSTRTALFEAYLEPQAAIDSSAENALTSSQTRQAKTLRSRQRTEKFGISPKDRSTQLAESKKLRRRKILNYAETEFVCDACGQEFVKKFHFILHRRTHSQEDNNANPAGEPQFPEERHLQTDHSVHVKKENVCPESNTSISSAEASKSELRRHMEERPYACVECGKRFLRKEHLSRHSLTHSKEKPYQCEACNKCFSRSDKLAAHRRRHTGEKPYACVECDKSFYCSNSLTKHRRTHSEVKPHVCFECKKVFTSASSLTNHLRTHTGSYTCTHCDERFSSKKCLRKHQLEHTGGKPHACTECDQRFRKSLSLKVHLLSHKGEKPFVCVKCNKILCSSDSLAKHLRLHNGERPYHCTHCDKKFSHNNTLVTHLRTHSGERPYACTKCDVRFRHKSTLRVHLKWHTGEKPFVCLECNKKFARSSYLKAHFRTHTGEKPYACTYCGNKFSDKTSLVAHVRIHTGERPYACTECDKRFRHKNTWRLHVRSHTGEKPYVCLQCNKKYARSHSLKAHLIRHTQPSPTLAPSANKDFVKCSL